MNIIPKMESSWNNVLKNEFQKDYFKESKKYLMILKNELLFTLIKKIYLKHFKKLLLII